MNHATCGSVPSRAKPANQASYQTKACWWRPTLKHLLQHYEPWQRTPELALFSAWIGRFGLASGCFISVTQCANCSLDNHVALDTWEWYHLGFSEINCSSCISATMPLIYVCIYIYYIFFIQEFHHLKSTCRTYEELQPWPRVGRQELIQFTDIPPTRRVWLLQLSFQRPSAQKGLQPCEFSPFSIMTSWQMICQKPLFPTTSGDKRKLLTDCTNAIKLHKKEHRSHRPETQGNGS